MAKIIRTYNETTKRYESTVGAPTDPSLAQLVESLTERISALEVALVSLLNKVA